MKQDFGAVCTTDEARRYFTECGLSYDDVLESDILVLIMLLNQEIRKANRSGETSVNTIRLSHKVNMKRKTNGRIIHCFLYLNSHYFTRREAISFNPNGFIGFAGWAGQRNTNPLLRAFLKWCDYLKGVKNEDEA